MAETPDRRSHAERRIGDRRIHAIGMGCMPLSAVGRPGRAQAIRTIHAAFDAGVRLFDTADAYALDENDVGHGERLLAEALGGHRADAIVATKGGHVRRGTDWAVDGTPAHLRAACEASLRNLGREAIELYQYHRPDPRVPFAESVGALRDLREEGKIVHVGLSNVTSAQIDEASRIVPIAAIQNELSLEYAAPLGNGEVAACEQRGIPLLAWSPFGGRAAAPVAPARTAAVTAAAEAHGVSPQRVVLAWLLHRSAAILPIPGSSRPETILDSAAAVELRLTVPQLEAIDAAANGLGRGNSTAARTGVGPSASAS